MDAICQPACWEPGRIRLHECALTSLEHARLATCSYCLASRSARQWPLLCCQCGRELRLNFAELAQRTEATLGCASPFKVAIGSESKLSSRAAAIARWRDRPRHQPFRCCEAKSRHLSLELLSLTGWPTCVNQGCACFCRLVRSMPHSSVPSGPIATARHGGLYAGKRRLRGGFLQLDGAAVHGPCCCKPWRRSIDRYVG